MRPWENLNMHIRESVFINATPEAVFPYVVDPEKSGEWDVKRLEMEILTEGPITKGSRVREVRKVPMGTQESIEEIVEFEENRVMGWATVEGKMHTTGSIRINPQGDTTEVTFDMSGGLPLMMKPFAFLISRMVSKEIRQNLTKLKGLAED